MCMDVVMLFYTDTSFGRFSYIISLLYIDPVLVSMSYKHHPQTAWRKHPLKRDKKLNSPTDIRKSMNLSTSDSGFFFSCFKLFIIAFSQSEN